MGRPAGRAKLNVRDPLNSPLGNCSPSARRCNQRRWTKVMKQLNYRMLTTACVFIAGAAAFAPGASAQTYKKGDIFGGGAAVPAPYARQTFDCYAKPTDLIISGT